MKTAVCYRGHYLREGGKSSNFFLCYENHKKMIFSKLKTYDIYFHSHKYDEKNDAKLINQLKPKKYSFKKTNYISDSFIESNEQIENLKNYDLIINLRFDLIFEVSFETLIIDYRKFNFLWEEKKHYRAQLGYPKVTDLMYAFNPLYLSHFHKAIEDTRFIGNRGTGHHLYPKLSESIGEENIGFMISKNYNSNTDNEVNNHVNINRNFK